MAVAVPRETRIEVFARRDPQGRAREVVGLDGVVDLPELGAAVAVRDVYTNIVLRAAASP